MSVPIRDGNGYITLPGGYQPNPQQAAQVPMNGPPQQPQYAQQAPQAAPPMQPLPWFQPGPVGAPVDTQPPPQYQPQQNPAFNPAFQPRQPQGQPGPQAGAPVQPQQPAWQPQAGTDLNTVLQGPNVPRELQGKTFAEAMVIYNGMRNAVIQMVPANGQQSQAPVAAQPTQVQPQAGFDWRNPEDSFKRVVRSEMQELMAPMLQQSQAQAIDAARRQAAATVGPQVFAAVEAQIMQRLQGADAKSLQNPQMWQTAAEAVIGGQVMQMARQQGQPQQVQTGQPQMQQQNVPQPTPNLNGFFTEQPTMGGPTGAPTQLTAQQAWVASQMNMDAATYAAWSGGGVRR